ncbi:glycosyltransferase family 2 protein [Flavobacterium sp. Fl-77]|uniref:Glycosyltransferase family 2 protein n=1 Tax=Flavobacterium flavipigmentatum TaxID=2893884 RepID=A0AAJ2VVQ4_9FLAO|nr:MULTISPECIES: glycosyltransferase family 2 protein [unclassified Flavobacterium]MDX6181899.1 glycosyltransferase family 2 protein [Flavobacterium sp. Fl-33]MDX6185067.1 glycosyltransferase family 2 protein [Flavobacterium sp. Fl-77]UFH37177.1 glycosyltransferase family 2 protein [Flavobacterium sp. F-70]
MLSILIPVYNYDVFALVEALHKQCLELKIEFEILCLDDASTQFIVENQKIKEFINTSFLVLEDNIGRSAIRNLLAQKAQYENLLFLDADTIPVDPDFITTYVSEINTVKKIVYGGILYQTAEPKKEAILRWIYGKKREALSVEQRNQNPFISFLTLNFLIKKSVFSTVKLNESIPNLRHEDTLFSYELMQNQIEIAHIKNPVYHLGIEDSKTFLRKSEEAVVGLKNLVDSQLISSEYVKLSYYFELLKKYYLTSLFALGFKIFKPLFRKQLLSKNPSMLLFDLYRLGYYCGLN